MHELRVFGIRHHGPGCARSLLAALEAYDPEIVLVEGPPDANGLLPLLPLCEPPVAILVYDASSPGDAAFYPFAAFSPEHAAICWALARGREVAFMDLPVARKGRSRFRGDDGIAALAAAAGFDDPEGWWEHQVELRTERQGLFEGLSELMAAARPQLIPEDPEEARREAWMRRTLRAARKRGTVAAVCGAWHVPALEAKVPVGQDSARLKGLKKRKVVATLVPWTHERLASASGYGAGVLSPGWYDAVWGGDEHLVARWVARAARLLRDEGLDLSSAHVLDAVQLADALASLRGRTRPSLPDIREAMVATMTHGQDAPLSLVRRRLEVGDALGSVPEGAPRVPLAADVAAQQRTLRLKPVAGRVEKRLDLRKETDRARSVMLHRLVALGIDWGTPVEVSGDGTFWEGWRLHWDPAYEVALVEASAWGSTLETAAEARAVEAIAEVEGLAELVDELDRGVLAALPGAVEAALVALADRAAVAADVEQLMKALPPLARVARYGDVRQTPRERLQPVLDGLFERILVGLAPACAQLDDGAAEAFCRALDRVHEAVSVLEGYRGRWLAAVAPLGGSEVVPPRVRGRCSRITLFAGRLDDEELVRRGSAALSHAVAPDQAAAWVEGLVTGPGLVLVHQDRLWAVLDGWLEGLGEDHFVAVLPALRRGFAEFSVPERRQMSRKVRALGGEVVATLDPRPIDPERAALVLPVLRRILGVAP